VAEELPARVNQEMAAFAIDGHTAMVSDRLGPLHPGRDAEHRSQIDTQLQRSAGIHDLQSLRNFAGNGDGAARGPALLWRKRKPRAPGTGKKMEKLAFASVFRKQ
jgi:hypothetical protein